MELNPYKAIKRLESELKEKTYFDGRTGATASKKQASERYYQGSTFKNL